MVPVAAKSAQLLLNSELEKRKGRNFEFAMCVFSIFFEHLFLNSIVYLIRTKMAFICSC